VLLVVPAIALLFTLVQRSLVEETASPQAAAVSRPRTPA
jgi:hypothetical protein